MTAQPKPTAADVPFTPSTSQVRSVYAVAVDPPRFAERQATFDRWLAEHDAQVAARALRDAAARARDGRATRGLWGRVQVNGRAGIAGWLNDEADRLAAGEQP